MCFRLSVRKGVTGMSYQATFKRRELKYILTREQQECIMAAMMPYMKGDPYGDTTIRNVYYDTDTYRLIRHSIEKPPYKEKLRLRSYRQADGDSEIFVELKKKYKGIVYKRRMLMPEHMARLWLEEGEYRGEHTQISREIDWFLHFYGRLAPSVFLSYDRQAFYCREDSGFRVTFDTNILCRQTDMSLVHKPRGTLLLPHDRVLMELKCSGGMPLWMAGCLSRAEAYKTSFSKYGTAYENIIFPSIKGDR